MRHPTIPTTSSEHQHDDYWKLKSYKSMTGPQMRNLLQHRNYPVGKGATKGMLEVSLLRYDSGMPSYAGQSEDQLRELIRARGIGVVGDNEDFRIYELHRLIAHINKGYRFGPRHDLLYLLEVSDTNPRFERFPDLPAELRNKIYEYYFAEIKQSLYAPSEPPIARVSTLLRKETIKMFYDSCTFDFVLRLPQAAELHRNLHGMAYNYTFAIPNQIRLFITSIASEHLACVRRINIRLVDHSALESTFQRRENTALTIELPEQGEQYALRSKNLLSILQCHGLQQTTFVPMPANAVALSRGDHIIKSIENVVKNVMARDGKAKLKVEDFFALRRALEEGLRQRV